MVKQYAITQFISNYYELCNLVVFIIARKFVQWFTKDLAKNYIGVVFSFWDLFFIALPLIRKTASLWIYIFLSTITFAFLFPFRGQRRLLLFNSTLFAQEIPKEIVLLCMDYDMPLRLENVRSQK